ncbi:MAG: hypothetical protein ACI89J_003256, partial [Hyphomicrobiaceae bacterium]
KLVELAAIGRRIDIAPMPPAHTSEAGNPRGGLNSRGGMA